jgi:hypothetical protein
MRQLLPRNLFTHAEDRRSRRRDHQFRPGSDLAAPGEQARPEKLEGGVLLTTYALQGGMIASNPISNTSSLKYTFENIMVES